MRRAALALVALVLALPACAGTERPEGIVERWLISLNQGAAGEPERYADDTLSDSVLPRRERLEPGGLDVIEVGDARAGPGGSFLVPFQVVELDGTAARAFAVLERRDGSLRIVRFQPPPDTGPAADPDFARRPRRGVPRPAWLVALGVAILLVVATAAVMRLVPEPGPRAEPGA